MAATSRARGSEEGLDDVMDVEKGRGAGSGQDRVWEAKALGIGIWGGVVPSVAETLWRRSLIGRRALVKNSLVDLVWL